MQPLSLFLATAPGLEQLLADEARAAGFTDPKALPGGVEIKGDWSDAARANRELRGASRVLARFAEFPVFHLAQLDKRSHKIDWAELLRPGTAVKVEATCRKSKIYHAGAAAQRVERAIADTIGKGAGEPIRLLLRIEDNLCTFSLDTSGEPLHRRGHKSFVGKAPIRETMAALFLRDCGFDGTEPLIDPMCGSGTFVLEAAEIALGLAPGRDRDFTLDRLAVAPAAAKPVTPRETSLRFLGYDRDDGAIRGAEANAERAGVAGVTTFARQAVSDLARPDGPPGLIMVNPPYGARIGDRKMLFGLYGALGTVLKERFSGWRVGIVTSDGGLAKATGLPFLAEGPPVAHGPLKVKLYRTDALS
ncbi:THUMP domain-containing class I SAM-dependent RNA methyltransferase [Pelagovum pacificum]|uniref:Class I SAM-dependent RNA methyltransferase n=1 Tax=Pelagovum pacificum TaxID=2588711 RepID=A0A5C5G896_9RHOB|nr:class I SAM-dependent RNA methyltransferase [Pelagovum pacificum]QQA41637.1 class I SAM-dependent RNA methyltransferase [Pelagovum pacificum]TNY30916.1 class I SAM-dependent RNA methyltransferase [Pelagovum pacificum]